MDVKTAYVSSIPADAKPTPGAKKRVDYFLNGQRVGERRFNHAGKLETEDAYKDGVRHGWRYRWHDSGILLSAEPYENGMPHGTAYQWAEEGRLIGTYTLEHGTGIDLWWQDWSDVSVEAGQTDELQEGKVEHKVELAEVHYLRAGCAHGYEWWFFYAGRSLSEERHWQEGILHGIERDWNSDGRLRRGFPRYWVRGERVPRAKYLKACAADATLPVFDANDNRPYRTFPIEIEKHLPDQ